jgi:hypothetical protein
VVAAQAVHPIAEALELHDIVEHATAIGAFVYVVAEQIKRIGGAQA